MENNEQDLDKIDKELTSSEPQERMENNSPISIEAKDDIERMEKEKRIVDDLMGKFNDWESSRQSRENLWEEIYRRYFTIADKRKTSTRSNITLPIIFQVVESAVPKIMNTLFASGEGFFDVVPINQTNEADWEKIPKIRKLLDVQLDKAQFFTKFLDFTKQLMLYGTSYFQVYWKVKRDWVWERIPVRTPKTLFGFQIGESIEWKETKSYKVIERRPEVEVVDILDVYPDPDAQNEDDGRGVFIRSWIDIDDLKELGKGKYPVYANTENDKLTGTEETYASSRQQRTSARGISTTDVKKKQVEILTFWGKYDIDGDGIKEEAQIVIGNRQVLLKGQGNPFHHQKRTLVRAVLFPVPKEWYGIGLVEPVLSEVHEVDTLRRQRIDNVNLVLNRMWQVNTFADVDLDTLISSPGNIILTDQMDAVKAVETQDVTGSAYNEAALVQQDIERATVPPSAQGSPTTGTLGRTARGAQLIIGQALEKFGTATKLIEEMALRKVLDLFYKLDLQFIDDDQILQDPTLYAEVADMAMTPEDLRSQIKFKMVGISEMVGSEAKINQLTAYEGMFANVLAPETNLDIAKKIYELMGLNPDDIRFAMSPFPPGQENIVQPGTQAAIAGQAANQGTQAAPVTAPQ